MPKTMERPTRQQRADELRSWERCTEEMWLAADLIHGAHHPVTRQARALALEARLATDVLSNGSLLNLD